MSADSHVRTYLSAVCLHDEQEVWSDTNTHLTAPSSSLLSHQAVVLPKDEEDLVSSHQVSQVFSLQAKWLDAVLCH